MSGINFWERSIGDYHKQLWADKVAFVQKIHDPVNIIKHLGRGFVKGQLRKGEWVDWGGYLPGGRSIWHESKDISGKSLRRSAFKNHQLSYLIQAGEQGCLSFVTIRSKEHDQGYAVPWNLLEYMPLKWHELDDYMIEGPRWSEVIL